MNGEPADDIRGSVSLMTTKDVILEMRSDLKKVGQDVSDLKKEHALVATALTSERESGIERRQRMWQDREAIIDRLDNHESEIRTLNTWKNEAAGAIRLARWALGASLLATGLMILDLIERFGSGV